MGIELHKHATDYPTTAYPERRRILEIRFAHDEGIDAPTFAVVDLDMDGNLPEDIDNELRWEIRRHMGRAEAMRYAGYEDVTYEMSEEWGD